MEYTRSYKTKMSWLRRSEHHRKKYSPELETWEFRSKLLPKILNKSWVKIIKEDSDLDIMARDFWITIIKRKVYKLPDRKQKYLQRHESNWQWILIWHSNPDNVFQKCLK